MSIDLQSSFSGTRPVADAHVFDVARLATWMREHLHDFAGGVHVEQFKGGQSNPTFLLGAGGARYVLRRKPPGVLLPSAHAVDREYRVIRTLAQTDVPVAKAYALCEDAAVIGSPFYLMEYVEGRIFWDAALPGMTPQARGAIYDEMNRVIAALHSVDPDAIGLGDYGRAGNYIERQVARWTKQYRASETERIEAADHLIDWLPKHLPAGDERRIVHGDYRLDNVIFDAREPRILAVLDWELSTLGHPLVDFAYHCMIWHMEAGARRGLIGLDLDALGIPGEKAYLQRYLQRAARVSRDDVSEVDWGYYLVFNMFRLVGILQGVMARALQGNASSALALETGKRTRPLAEQAWALAREVDAMR
ncbi:phosphotransferase [Paraburkholderia tropica]|uniref:Predicted kinase, aminoglycoside phosphotransferase (APT) family n=1 Tax=Paraburkholderia tropica TaxID=92647 RepID=A0AAQ1JTV8_9BURK|nr:phosphotransferase [Paraburkholderia tropica]RQN37708.1 phosphotransferase family protein [Paraburkholderia tropica]SEJ58772.1 Predicted kinase, aminoglycoside phosphotransferase (APT) family [Paraburkholderia tropica]